MIALQDVDLSTVPSTAELDRSGSSSLPSAASPPRRDRRAVQREGSGVGRNARRRPGAQGPIGLNLPDLSCSGPAPIPVSYNDTQVAEGAIRGPAAGAARQASNPAAPAPESGPEAVGWNPLQQFHTRSPHSFWQLSRGQLAARFLCVLPMRAVQPWAARVLAGVGGASSPGSIGPRHLVD